MVLDIPSLPQTLAEWEARFLSGSTQFDPKPRGVKKRRLEYENQLGCDHSISAGGLCFVCGRQITFTAINEENKIPLRYILDDFSLSKDDMLTFRSTYNRTNLLEKKKLSLVLDLDNTLLHSVKFKDLKCQDIAHFGDFQKDNIFVLPEIKALTKLRPFALEFLVEVSKMFELHVYTMGTRSYANVMANLLDPDGTYFDWRVISKEDCTVYGQKNLDVVIGEENAVVIVDDKAYVWGKHWKNVLPIKPYYFWEKSREKRTVCKSHCGDLEELELMLETLKKLHHFYFNPNNCVDVTKRDVRDFMKAAKKFYLERSNPSNNNEGAGSSIQKRSLVLCLFNKR